MLCAIEDRQLLAGIKNKANTSSFELVRVIPHCIAAIGGDDADIDAFGFLTGCDQILVRIGHRAGVKASDLVVRTIRHDGAQSGVAAAIDHDQARVNPHLFKAIQVIARIRANSTHWQRLAAQLLQAIGNVARAAAVFFAHAGCVEGNIEFVNLIGQNLLRKIAHEAENGVDSNRAADDGRHGYFLEVKVKMRVLGVERKDSIALYFAARELRSVYLQS